MNIHHTEVIKLYQATRDKIYFDKLVMEFMPIIKKWAKRYSKRGKYYEDMIQAGKLGLWKGLINFKADTNLTAYLYLQKYIKGVIVREYEKYEPLTEEQMKSIIAEDYTDKASDFRLMDHIAFLDDEDRHIILSYSIGKTFAEIATKLNSKEHTIRRKWHKIVEKLREEAIV